MPREGAVGETEADPTSRASLAVGSENVTSNARPIVSFGTARNVGRVLRGPVGDPATVQSQELIELEEAIGGFRPRSPGEAVRRGVVV